MGTLTRVAPPPHDSSWRAGRTPPPPPPALMPVLPAELADAAPLSARRTSSLWVAPHPLLRHSPRALRPRDALAAAELACPAKSPPLRASLRADSVGLALEFGLARGTRTGCAAPCGLPSTLRSIGPDRELARRLRPVMSPRNAARATATCPEVPAKPAARAARICAWKQAPPQPPRLRLRRSVKI